jgi:penicillin-binding protein 1A
MHVVRDYCTEGKCLATFTCLPECVTQVGVLDCVRVPYFKKDGITPVTTEDAPYVVEDLEKAIGLRPTIAADGTETYPEVLGCPIHSSGFLPGVGLPPYLDPSDPNYMPPDPNDPNYVPVDPSDPNYMPPDPNQGGAEIPSEPSVPTEPTEPADPTAPDDPLANDPTGGFGDATGEWWMNLGA